MKKKSLKKPQRKISFLPIGLFLFLFSLIFLLILQVYDNPPSMWVSLTPPPKLLPTPTPPPISYAPQIFGNQVRVPILLYHYIGNNPDSKDKARESVSLGPDKFEEQMKYLADNGHATISLDILYPSLKKQLTLPQKPVILTFDDGYMDFYYNAYPILKKYHLSATVFIPTSLMNQGYYLTWDQIKEMASSGTVTFGSHGVHHYHLISLSTQALNSEIIESKKVLQNLLGIPINFLAYPYGSVNTHVIEQVKNAGYMGAVGTWPSKTQSEGTIYNMPRLRIGGNITLENFISLL